MKKTLHLFFISLALLMLGGCASTALQLETDALKINIDGKGFITSIYDKNSSTEYLAANQAAPLLTISVDSTYQKPTAIEWNESEKTLTINFTDQYSAEVAVKNTDKYITLELQKVDLPQGAHLDLALWGSYPTTINQIVGECVGVVRDSTFAFGIRALNPKTIGGYPTLENDIDPMYDIFATNSIVDVEDSVKVLYRGHTAEHTEYGSKLHAYTRNRDKDRIIEQWGHTHYFAPAYDDGGAIGSAIAIFGSPAAQALDYLEAIVVGEDMPYPQISGEWNKKSPDAAQAYIIYPFNENNIDQAIEFTKSTGLKYLYHGGPFSTWGKFELNPSEFPSGIEGLRQCVETAAKDGIKLGVHTLSNFTTLSDEYVSPVPDQRLGKVGSSTITANITVDQTEIQIADPMFFNQMQNNSLHGVMIGE
ncbi:MAG: hypothetical protein R3Y19_02320 [Rikenellaceae bacterium]